VTTFIADVALECMPSDGFPVCEHGQRIWLEVRLARIAIAGFRVGLNAGLPKLSSRGSSDQMTVTGMPALVGAGDDAGEPCR
jgi:hypothetical protein